MNFKTTYGLFIVLIALLAVFAIWQSLGSKPGSEAYMMASMRRADVTTDKVDGVVLQRKSEKLVFVRNQDNQWKLVEPFEDRVDKFAIEDLIRQVIDARREEQPYRNVCDEMSSYAFIENLA